MKPLEKLALVGGFLLLFVYAAFPQTPPAALPRMIVGPVGVVGASPPGVTSAPYSATEETENTQTLSDGTHIATKTHARFYRDSQGRTRTERFLLLRPGVSDDSTPTLIEINDPFTGVHYSLEVQNHFARRLVMTPPNPMRVEGFGERFYVSGTKTTTTTVSNADRSVAPPPGWFLANRVAVAPDAMRPQTTSEDLGTQIIEGVLAEGKRTTTTFPVGSQGNDRPLVTTNESWYSQDLRMMVLSKFSDPRSGEHITRLVNIDRAEPDPSLFQVPADYTIEDQGTR